MKYRFILLILLLSFSLSAQKIFTFDWGTSQCATSAFENKVKIPLKTWQLSFKGSSQTVQAPFVVSYSPQISATTQFRLSERTKDKILYLQSNGIKGSATFFLNDHLISFISNAQQPFKIQLPSDFLKNDSMQTLRLLIKQPQNTHDGFPLIVYTYSESHTIGIASPLWIIAENKPVISGFNRKLVHNKNGFILNYSYQVHVTDNFNRLQLNESFVRHSDQKTIFQKIRFAKDLTNKTIHIQGEFPLSRQDLWEVNNPQKIVFKLHVRFSGNKIKEFERTFVFGARTFRWLKGRFYLNEAHITIHGITWHQNLRRLNHRNYAHTLRSDLTRIKAMGINTIRFSHFLPDDLFLNLCDSLGIMVMGELPIWRYPVSFFNENYLLEMAKTTCLQMAPFYRSHPSFVALGLGQEIPADNPITQKFMFILKGKVKTLLPVLTYVSPIPGRPLPPEKVADFYLLDLYRPLNVLQDSKLLTSISLVGKIGVLPAELFHKEQSEETHAVNRGLFLKEEIGKAIFQFKTAGGFIESYQDWFAPFPSLVVQNRQAPYIVPQGLYRINGEPKAWTKLLGQPWELDESTIIQTTGHKQRPTNFFSVLVTFIVILFFSLYRRLPRLRENLRRSLRHSYGFFVDMRERRIIPLLNSVTVGIFFSLIAAAFVASQIYYVHGSYGLQEMMAVFLVPLGLFAPYLHISQSSVLLTLTLFAVFFLLPFTGAVAVKIFSLFTRARIRLRQGIAVMYWSGAPLLWFFPVSLISYHWVFYHHSAQIFWIILGLFFVWIHFRLVKGLHILFFTGSSTVFVVLLLCYSVPLLIFWALFNPPSYWLEYLKLLMNAQALF